MDSLRGQLLIASPRLMDPHFHQTVVLLVHHDTEGAMGLVLNRPTTLQVAQIWHQVTEDPCVHSGLLHTGGPCEGVLMALHTQPDAAQETVTDDLYFTTERSHLTWLMSEGGHAPARVFSGHAGWGPQQLEAELKESAWLLLPATRRAVFADPSNFWLSMLACVDPTFTRIIMNPALQPPDQSMN